MLRLERLIQLAFCVVLMLCSVAAIADDGVLITSTTSEKDSRAWGLYTNTQGDQLLVYFAPRDVEPGTPDEFGVQGKVQAVRALGRREPIAMAAVGDRVYLAFPPVRAQGKRLIRIYSLRALPSPVGGLWVLDPADQFDVSTPIEASGSLIGLQGAGNTLWALMRDDEQTRLLRMGNNGWDPLELPAEIDTRRIELTAIGSNPVIVDRSGTRFIAHQFDPETESWTTFDEQLSIGRETQLLSGRRAITAIDHVEDGARVRLWSQDGVFVVAQGLELEVGALMAMLDSSTTLIGLRSIESDEESEAAVELIELDARTGEVRHAGPPIVASPVSPEEFRFIVVMMVLVMGGVLVVVILPDRTNAMHIPEGYALADPGRRMVAMLLDVVVVAAIVGRVFGVSVTDILTLTVLIRPDNAWVVFPMIIVAGVVYSSVSEVLFGASPGKLMMGLRVVAAEPGEPKRAKLWSVLVRNVIKWVLPPVAALALVDPEALHRGDRTSKSLVVVPRVVDEPNDG